MSAVEFVKKHGWEEAKKFLNLPSYTIDQLLMLQSGLRCNELQKLVDSWELVIVWRMPESWRDAYDGDVLGLEGARMYLEMFGNHELTGKELERFKQAIADVESVGGGV
ncbi:hypothetical protein [Acinetobacter guillouiae]|uniref:hypothetical protein n=1 Tax=Acinetobacter guillouiae TaxID=106649 RepID=UPI0022E40233|nr:hypothetical protein [Acinetobacter guillouiae]